LRKIGIYEKLKEWAELDRSDDRLARPGLNKDP
jgi:hypothetical protein